MNTVDILFRYIKEPRAESSLGVVGAAASIAVCLVAASTQPIESNAFTYQFAVSSMGFLTVAILLSLSMMSEPLLKRQEIGTLRALGARKRVVMAIFLSKSILIGTLGSVAGIALGFAFTIITHVAGQPYQAGEPILRMLTVGSAGSLVAAVYVAVRASRMNIVEMMRG